MEKIRIAIAKNAATQYVGHLDFCRALERALRRAKLPVAFSEGFNPHMKLSFGPALGVGVASTAEYVDVELQTPLIAQDFGERLSRQLPPGLEFVEARSATSTASLAAALNIADYQAEIAIQPETEWMAQAHSALAAFMDATEVMYLRRTPKGEKNLDLKKFLIGGLKLEKCAARITVGYRLKMMSSGAVKPQEIINALKGQFAFPGGAACFTRTGLWCDTGAVLKTAFDI